VLKIALDNYYNDDNVESEKDYLAFSQAKSIEALTIELLNLKVIPDNKITSIALLLSDPYYRQSLIPLINLTKTSKKFGYHNHLLKGIELISNGIKENAEKSFLGRIRDKLPF
jgi:hypothetical protein